MIYTHTHTHTHTNTHTQVLIELICNVQDMEDAVVEMKYDVKRAPLGKASPFPQAKLQRLPLT